MRAIAILGLAVLLAGCNTSSQSQRTVGGAAIERTEVMVGAGFREPTGRPLARPLVAGQVERTEVLDSGQVVRERPPRRSVGLFVGLSAPGWSTNRIVVTRTPPAE